jgi:hypothetical protein
MKKRYSIAQILKLVATSDYSFHQQNVFKRIKECKTPAMGGYVSICENEKCLKTKTNFQSCRDRNCECNFKRRQESIIKVVKGKFPVKHFHVTATMPHECNGIYLYNRRKFTKLILKANQKSIMQVAKDKWNVKSGGIAHFHSHGSDLKTHPHVHTIVPSGGISLKNGKWKSFRHHYLAHEKVIAGAFKNFFLRGLKKMIKKGSLNIPEQLGYIDVCEATLYDFVSKLCDKKWKADVQPSKRNEVHVVRYLTGYQRRSPLSNRRILNINENNMVTFQYKDYKNKKNDAVKTISAEEFVKRFSNHISENGTHKTSNFGIYGNAFKKRNVKLANDFVYAEDKIEHSKQRVGMLKQVYRMNIIIEKVIEKAKQCSFCQSSTTPYGNEFGEVFFQDSG